MNCAQCGATLQPDSAFCSECGTKVPSTAEPSPRGATTQFLEGATHFVGPPDSAMSSQRLEPGTEFHDRYTIEKLIGSGGMGVVYQAMDSVTQRPVALKLINPRILSGEGAVDRLIAEGLLTRDIRHPNVVAVYDVAQCGDQPYVTMEHIAGQSLRAWLGRQLSSGGEVSVSSATSIIEAVLDGLQAAHDVDVVHRDLKPENIMLLDDPNAGDFRLKILDFGIARAADVSLLESSASALGTPLYMAPEQRTSPEAAGPAADLYSLSRIFYELLMDVLPDGHWQPPSKHNPDVPVGLDALLEKGLSNRPRSRQQSVEEYRSEMQAALASAPGPAPTPGPTPEPGPKPPDIEKPVKSGGKWNRKKIGIAVGAGLLGILVLAAIQSALDGGGGGNLGGGGGSDLSTALSGTWYDEQNSAWRVNVSGGLARGSGYVEGVPVELSGSFAGTSFSGVIVNSNGQVIFNVSGTLNGTHLDTIISNNFGQTQMRYHINHTPR